MIINEKLPGKNMNAYILYLATKIAVFNMFFIKM